MKRIDWSKIKVGDELMVKSGFGGVHYYRVTVDRILKKYFVDSRGGKWHLKNGREWGGGGWSRLVLMEVDERLLAEQHVRDTWSTLLIAVERMNLHETMKAMDALTRASKKLADFDE